ncbi:acyl carrier protein [Hymenobacter sp. CRA2]|uniref:acyl carrier protein n=1 Tax=Hymenobacter sp. CRA2 TaxID=1955620 RepID=UPI00098F4140|nr:acyl carrier protein [Hymenobacter sp. CRA2]OON67941.1 hypothetical protein B0919_14815 [Hymenobacter sp. CRA2]
MGLDTVELIVAVEDFFGFSIPDTEAEQMGTVQQIADGVCRLRGGCDATTPSRIQQGCHATIRRELQAALRLARRPDSHIPLTKLLPTTAANWRPLLAGVAGRTGWRVPEFTDPQLPAASWLGRLFRAQPERWVDWRQATVGDLVDWTVSLNYPRFYHGPDVALAYDVLRIVTGIVAERSGHDIWEIRPPDSITHDLGMD